MAKVAITKRQYEKKKAVIENQIQEVVAELEQLKKTVEEPYKYDMIRAEKFNALHDKKRELENDLNDLENAFARRYWTAADYALRELVVQNID